MEELDEITNKLKQRLVIPSTTENRENGFQNHTVEPGAVGAHSTDRNSGGITTSGLATQMQVKTQFSTVTLHFDYQREKFPPKQQVSGPELIAHKGYSNKVKVNSYFSLLITDEKKTKQSKLAEFQCP